MLEFQALTTTVNVIGCCVLDSGNVKQTLNQLNYVFSPKLSEFSPQDPVSSQRKFKIMWA